MSEYLEDIAYLSQEIGPRPAGTEEEQDAAAYISDALTKRVGLPAEIEDFSCNSKAELPTVILSVLAALFCLLAIFVKVLAIPAIIVGLVCAAFYMLEVLDKPLLSKVFSRGISQNVVAKYRPDNVRTGRHSRKIIVVANYDSGKVRTEMGFAGILAALQKASAGAVVAIPLIWIIRSLFHIGNAGMGGLIWNVISVIAIVLALIPLLLFIMHATAEYNEAANFNAAGVAALLEVADRIANTSIPDEDYEGTEAEIHGENAARQEDLIPEGAEVVYDVAATAEQAQDDAAENLPFEASDAEEPAGEDGHSPEVSAYLAERRARRANKPASEPVKEEGGMNAALAAIAAMTGRPIEEVVTDNYRQNHVEEAANQTMESEPEVGVEAETAVAQGEDFENAVAEQPEYVAGNQATQAGVINSESAQINGYTPSYPAPTPSTSSAPKIPDWYTAAQKKADRSKWEERPVRRSRFASALDEAVATSTAFYDAANKLVDREEHRIESNSANGIVEVPAPAEYVMPAAQSVQVSQSNSEPAAEVPAYSSVDERPAASAAPVETAVPVDEPTEQANLDTSFDIEETEGVTQIMEPIVVQEPVHEQLDVDEMSPQSVAPEVDYVPGRVLEHAPELQSDAAYNAAVDEGYAQNRVEVTDEDLQELKNEAFDEEGLSTNRPRPSLRTAKPRSNHRSIGGFFGGLLHHDDESIEDDALEAEADAYEKPEELDPSDVRSYSRDRYLRRNRIPAASAEVTEREPGNDTPGSTTAISPIDVSELRAQAANARGGVTRDLLSRKAREQELAARRGVERVNVDDVEQEQAEQAQMAEARAALAVDLPSIGIATQPAAATERANRHNPDFSDQIPRINLDAFGVSTSGNAASVDERRAALRNNLPSMSGSITMEPSLRAKREAANVSVSQSGAFTTVPTMSGKMAPVGNELLEGMAPDEVYIDDVDDSSYATEVTNTGAYAGPGYVEMPESRSSRFMSRFHRKGKKKETSAQEWLEVDDEFNATQAGAARGGWDSFNEENRGRYYGRSNYNDDDEWNGGAFSKIRENISGSREGEDAMDEPGSSRSRRRGGDGEVPAQRRRHTTPVNLMEGLPIVMDEAALMQDEINQVQDFHMKRVTNEVWFVALGSENAGNGGAKAFMAQHADELRGAVIINIEGIGAGDFCYYETEGAYRPKKISSRLKRVMRAAQRDTGISAAPAKMEWKDSLASLAMKAHIPAITLTGMNGNAPAFMGRGDDVAEIIESKDLAKRIDFIESMIRNV